ITGDLTEEKVAAQKAWLDPEIDKLGLVYGKAVECHWRRRIHHVPVHVQALDGWVKDRVQTIFDSGFLTMGFAIDRFQRIRNLGMLHPLGGDPGLNHLWYEVRYFDFEWERAQAMAAEEVLVIPLITQESTGGSSVDVALPSAEELLAYDTLEIDLQSWCNDHLEGDPENGCPEWDTGASLHVAEVPIEADAEAQVDGTCEPGDGADVAAETMPCTCSVPSGGTRPSVRTCQEGGAAFGACLCNGTWEIARWITTYSREGRWVSDASFFLPIIAGGGTVRMNYSPGNTYITNLSLRLSNRDKADRAASVTPLYQGGSFNSAYNEAYEPMEVMIPETAKRAEIVALITGHGFGVEIAGCAEFCNHTHHFTVGEGEVVHDNPWVGNFYGCADQVPDGVVPNQYGTWTLGRGGWCPGLDVKPFVADVTEFLTPGEPATLSYEALFMGKTYEPQPNPDPSANGFPGNIWMYSWLVTYE
ncbi:MAG: peptide-N-glycosidase F-related protein, partial [Myxococcota bacterium]|nr:peptide-N-glycosidase F-related protein [Myxococcota bacterium]